MTFENKVPIIGASREARRVLARAFQPTHGGGAMQDPQQAVKQVWQAWLGPADRVVVGVSGGADSVALLRLLAAYAPGAGRRMLAVHVHHGLRGPAADADQRFVLRVCARLGVPCAVYRGQAAAWARRWHLPLEEAGRRLRHACLLDAAAAFRARAVALAHHQDDQAETLLLHLLRGAGGRGLSAMRAVRPFPHPGAPPGLKLLRPLLGVPRAALENYLRAAGGSWRRDRTNRDLGFARNRIRHQLIPSLQKNFNPRATAALSQSADLLAKDDDLLAEMARRALARTGRPGPQGGFSLSTEPLRHLPESLQGRVFSLLWDHLGLPAKSYDWLRLFSAALENRRQARWNLPGRWTAVRSGAWLRFIPPGHGPVQRAAFRQQEVNPGSIFGVKIETVPVPKNPGRRRRRSTSIVVDARKIQMSGLRIRFRQPGDSMRPLGLQGRKSLKKIMNEMRIPAAQRVRWPLLLSGENIIWVYRGPTSEEVKIGPGTKKALKIEIIFKKSRSDSKT